ncbi:NAD(P)/FAD-dependent oxidoreductase [Maritimibacter alkaliphilus]|uniref:NAD(P)/FAD-dependent oxidoreductase n=1 Tax=Maritimibacter alkaliphilus TaxID=404236 RepID=UPI001C971EDD|nr:FAD-binding oxidoreductase [Maritimibacter alkaliphilus]MBY6092200.1 FAD-binding oxidoreductase [Maritimibacter alkaliphilus]
MTQTPVAQKRTPYWWEAAPVGPAPDAPLATAVDVAIVGAGYAGLSAGIELVRAGRTVAAFDKMNPGEGASSRNGGITSGNIRLDFDTLKKRHGEDRALAIEAEGKVARDFLYDFIKTEGLECDFQPVGRYNGALGKEQYEKGARNAETLQKKLGIEAYAVPRSEQLNYLGSEHYRGGAVRMDIGGLHPAKFHAEMLRVALAAGVSVHSGTAVLKVEKDVSGFKVTTSKGIVKARQVLVCTNGYTDGSDKYLRRRMVPVRSRMIATEEIPLALMDQLMPKRMMVGEHRKLGFYYRPSPDHTRILLGGRDASQAGDPDWPVTMLKDGLDELFPELKSVGLSHTWYGNVAMHRDMLPRIFEHDGLTYATGFCGSGVVWATWIGNRAARKLLNDDKAKSAFDFRPPTFVPFYAGKPYFMPAFIQMYRMQDRRDFARQTR